MSMLGVLLCFVHRVKTASADEYPTSSLVAVSSYHPIYRPSESKSLCWGRMKSEPSLAAVRAPSRGDGTKFCFVGQQRGSGAKPPYRGETVVGVF